jgi:hypothetical protein
MFKVSFWPSDTKLFPPDRRHPPCLADLMVMMKRKKRRTIIVGFTSSLSWLGCTVSYSTSCKSGISFSCSGTDKLVNGTVYHQLCLGCRQRIRVHVG